MKKISCVIQKNRYLVAIFLIAIVIRAVLVLSCFKDGKTLDGVMYHNLAVNVVLGNGYSDRISPPYDPNFFREPAYPLFLAGGYVIWNSIFGKIHYLKSNIFSDKEYPEIVFLKFFQAIIGSVACGIFFLLLKECHIQHKISFCIAAIYATYIPLAIYSTQIMRETFQTFTVILMSYFFAKYLIEERLRWLILFSIFLAASNMTLQVTIFIPILMAIFIYLKYRSFSKTIRDTVLSSVIMFLLISPWLVRSYAFYPDWRIIKSLGVSLTYEQLKYASALLNLETHHLITKDEVTKLFHEEWYGISEREKFEKSFNGYFSTQAKELQNQIRESNILFQTATKIVSRFRIFWLESLWVTAKNGRPYERPHTLYKQNKNYLFLLLSSSGFIFGYLAIPGIFLYYKRLFPSLLVFTYFLIFFYFISGSPRHAYPVHAFIITFSCLSIITGYLWIIKKKTLSEIKEYIFVT